MKTKWLAAIAGIALAVSVGAGPASAAEVRIGFIAPMTGIFAQVGKDMSNGFKMYLEDKGHKMGPLKVKFILEDSTGKPAVNVRKAMKLVQRDKVHMFLGGVLASTGYALAPVADRFKIPYISPVPAADDLTQRKLYKYFLRSGFTSSQNSHPLGEWAYDQGYRRIVMIGADYAFGYETLGGFQKAFEERGGKIIKKIWAKLGTKDFGPYLPQIPKNADAIMTLMVGPMSLAFPKQFRAAGFKMPMLGGVTSADEFTLPSMGDEALGYVTSAQYSAALTTDKNKAFVKDYQKRFGKMASYYSETSYTTGQWIELTLKKIGYKPGKTLDFIQAFKTIRIDAIRGPVYLDKFGNPVQNSYVRKVERVPGDRLGLGVRPNSLWNVVIKTYPAVGQFWKWPSEEFLKQPVYSKTFPNCPNCE
ncbi:MAG: ABC transporter substrate-binding protein [bacterium]|nr:ABC transporter substrate-binding protein [bacterium]